MEISELLSMKTCVARECVKQAQASAVTIQTRKPCDAPKGLRLMNDGMSDE